MTRRMLLREDTRLLARMYAGAKPVISDRAAQRLLTQGYLRRNVDRLELTDRARCFLVDHGYRPTPQQSA